MNFELPIWNYFFPFYFFLWMGAGSEVALDDFYVNFAHTSVR